MNNAANKALDLFLLMKAATGASPRTVTYYKKHIEPFLIHHPTAWNGPADMRTAFLEWITETDSPATFNHRLMTLRPFWRFCIEENMQPPEPDPFRGIHQRAAPSRFRDIDAAKVKELLSLPDRKTWIGLRDYALMLFTLDTAARPGEALQLMPADFDLSSFAVSIPAPVAKTRRPRIIPFSPSTAAALDDLARNRPPEWEDTAPVFASVTGRAYGVDQWNKQLKRYRLSDGFTFRPYDLRHASCTLHLRAGMNGETLQRLMGHSTPAMTQRYIHLTNDDLKKAQALTSPVESLAPRGKRAPRTVK